MQITYQIYNQIKIIDNWQKSVRTIDEEVMNKEKKKKENKGKWQIKLTKDKREDDKKKKKKRIWE